MLAAAVLDGRDMVMHTFRVLDLAAESTLISASVSLGGRIRALGIHIEMLQQRMVE